jgi:signal peptidase I
MHHHPWNWWWRHATWASVAGWTAGVAAGGTYGEPIYYDYGDNVYYDGEEVYVNGAQVATAPEYYQQASNIATAAPDPASTPDADWLPLGVFALSQGNVASSNMVLQLSVNKEGVISGTYYNTATDTSRPVKGMVDKKSQRAAWTFADGKNTDIIMETGLYNLTQDQTSALVHFGEDKTQQWLMVRLNEPEDKKEADQKVQGS